MTHLPRLVLCDASALSLTITAASAITAAAPSSTDRRLAGLALPFGVPGQTSAGPLTVNAGTVQLPTDLRRVKLFTEHGRQTPVGYATEATETADGLRMAFRVGATPSGDAALIEAAEGIRDALSVELSNVEVSDGVVTAGELVAVVLTSVPAFADARIAATRAAVVPVTSPPGPGTAVVPARPAGGAMVIDVAGGALPPELTRRRTGVTALAAVMPAMAAAIRDNDIGRVNAALSDVVPGMDTGGGATGTGQWLGELWTPIAQERHFWPRVQHQTLTTGLKVYGWKWGTLPAVGPYAGNKAAILSNAVTMVPGGSADRPLRRRVGYRPYFGRLGRTRFSGIVFPGRVGRLGEQARSGIGGRDRSGRRRRWHGAGCVFGGVVGDPDTD